MPTGKKQYQEEAIAAVRSLLGLSKTSVADGEELRVAIDGLPDQALLLRSVADYWLDLGVDEARMRRRNSPPPSPFIHQRLAGRKSEVAEWDFAWRLRRAKESARYYKGPKALSLAALMTAPQPWLAEVIAFGSTEIVSHAQFLPRDVDAADVLVGRPARTAKIIYLSVANALQRRWDTDTHRDMWRQIAALNAAAITE